MRWTPTYQKSWHRWFAWFPVEVENYDRVWLEWVERDWNFTDHEGKYKYRTVQPNPRRF